LGALHKDLRTFMISHSILPWMRYSTDKIVQKITTHNLVNNFFPKIVLFITYGKIQ